MFSFINTEPFLLLLLISQLIHSTKKNCTQENNFDPSPIAKIRNVHFDR